MRVKIGVYLYFAALLLPGIGIGLWLKHYAGVAVNFPLSLDISGAFSVSAASIAVLYVALMRLPLIIFCTGYTVFAPVTASLSVLYLGAMIGSRGGPNASLQDRLSVPTLLVLSLLLTVFIFLCGQAASHRLLLRTSAPDAKSLMHSPSSRRYFCFFLAVATVYLGGAILLAFFTSA